MGEGGGCFVDNVSEGWGVGEWGELVLGVKAYLIHSGAGLIKALTCPGGRRGCDSMCVLGVEESEKKCGPPPQDNFWNSPYFANDHVSGNSPLIENRE